MSERECVWVRESVCVSERECVCECGRESVCGLDSAGFLCERERARIIKLMAGDEVVCVCVCVCVSE